jgi:hypothetical protein
MRPRSNPTRNILTKLSKSALLLAAILALTNAGLAADPPADSQPVVTDAAGKQFILKKWKIAGGVRKLGWLADKPEAFELREFGSTTFKEGVLTLVPMSRIDSIRYEYDKETANVHLAGLDRPLQGTTKYKDINMITVRAEVDQGASGVADLRFVGGLMKGGFKEIKFAGAKTPEAPAAKGELFSFLIVPEGKGKSGVVATAMNVQALYRSSDGSEKLLPYVMFKKTLKIDLNDIQKIGVGEQNVKEKTAECEVLKKDGSQLSITLLGSTPIDGKPATLVGLLGAVDVGWKLFPIHTFTTFQRGELKIEDKKAPEAPKKDSKP